MRQQDPYAEFAAPDPYAEFAAPKAEADQPSWFNSMINAVVDFGKGANRTGNPFAQENINGFNKMLLHPIEAGKQALAAQGQMLAESKQSMQSGQYLEGIRHAISYFLPVIGPAIDEAGNKAGTGRLAEGMGEAAGIALPAALGMRQPSPMTPKAGITQRARDLYQGALKPSTTMPLAKARELVETGLSRGIPVSAEGAAKLDKLVGDLNTAIDSKIKQVAPTGASVDKFKVASRLNETAKDFATQAAPTKDLNLIADTGNDFLATKPNQIPITDAQEIKKGTYRQLKDKAFGTVQTAEKESQKALARGLKEEIAAQIPELTDLNAEEGRLLGLDKTLEKAVNRAANRTGKKLTAVVVGTGVDLATGSPLLGAGIGMMKAVLEDPDLRSRLAIAINKAQQRNPTKWGAPSIKRSYMKVESLVNALSTTASGRETAPAP